MSNPPSQRFNNAYGKTKAIPMITNNTENYASAINKALMLTFQDPTAPNDNDAFENRKKETENLLSRFHDLPYKVDFIDSFKIRGR